MPNSADNRRFRRTVPKGSPDKRHKSFPGNRMSILVSVGTLEVSGFTLDLRFSKKAKNMVHQSRQLAFRNTVTLYFCAFRHQLDSQEFELMVLENAEQQACQDVS